MAIRSASHRRLSLKEFLSLPETEPPSELIDGEVVQKPVPRLKHNFPIRNLIRILDAHPHTSRGTWLTEQGLNFPGTHHGNHRVPDLAWFAPGRIPDDIEDYPDFPPDLAVEVRSRGQSLASLRERLQFLRDNGTSVGLLIDPEARTVELVTNELRSYREGEQVTIPGLDGLSFLVDELFAR